MIEADFLIKTLAIPVASALIGSFVTTARNEALVATKLDHISATVQRIEQDQKDNVKIVSALKEEQLIIKYRVDNLEKGNAKEGRIQEGRH